MPRSRRGHVVCLTGWVAVLAVSACGARPADPGTAGTPAGVTPGAATSSAVDPAPTSVGVTAPPSSVTVDTTDVATDSPVSPTTATSRSSGGSAQRRPVTVMTTYAGVVSGGSAVEAGGYVDGITESDGVCTLTLTRGSSTRTATAEATPDATTTACGGLAVALSDLDAGTWEAVLTYESPRSAGEADAVEVEVP